MVPPASAPHTSHLRKRLRRGARKLSTAVTESDESNVEKNPLLVDTRNHHWLPIPSDKKNVGFDSKKSVQQDTNKSCGAEDKQLCTILQNLATQFETEKRMYAAIAARSAIRLVEDGRHDDINAGLWQHICREEQKINLSKPE